ncbi:interleukin-1 receptor-associated kinase 4-like [Saccoglossus kowalevskii]|uniref:Interleukin-1 receptor-associated kinase 4-like n=1 Tax=Saccoglossus kowalevskii TaxID=10224 RepID=A0ABM0GXH2_SACKO|nr:PREDICTED: interleukin-1 receptor-associated kinase 4-like [Saccoglossus kowalevskii]
MSSNISPKTLVRKIPYGVLRHLTSVLDIPSPLNRNWEGLAAIIPKRSGSSEMKYRQIDIQTFALEHAKPNGSPTLQLLSDWGTQNATCQELVELLLQLDLIAAAEILLPDYVHQKKTQQQETRAPNATRRYGDGGGDRGSSEDSWDNAFTKIQQPVSQVQSLQSQVQSSSTLSSAESTSLSSSTITHTNESKPSMNLSNDKPSSKSVIENPSKLSKPSSSMQKNDIPRDFPSDTTSGNRADNLKDITEKMKEVKITTTDSKVSEMLGSGNTDSPAPLVSMVDTSVEHSGKTAEIRMTLQEVAPDKELSYTDLSHMTDGFNISKQEDGGNFIGEGAFGIVFLGNASNGNKLAIKKLKVGDTPLLSRITEQFKNEIKTLFRCKHVNLVPLLGYSCDCNHLCLVYEYMCNGSLQDRLMCNGNTPPLSWTTRVSISKDVAKGITYLHSENLIHRDIKSANVLLDENFVAKVGDFGLIRPGPEIGHSITRTSTVFGTSPYMPKEAFSGTITPKQDTYSYGVVLLEIMTGLPVFDESRKSCDLCSHVEDECDADEDFISIVDSNMNDWNEESITELYLIALKCLEHTRKKRPFMAEILPRIERL